MSTKKSTAFSLVHLKQNSWENMLGKKTQFTWFTCCKNILNSTVHILNSPIHLPNEWMKLLVQNMLHLHSCCHACALDCTCLRMGIIEQRWSTSLTSLTNSKPFPSREHIQLILAWCFLSLLTGLTTVHIYLMSIIDNAQTAEAANLFLFWFF